MLDKSKYLGYYSGSGSHRKWLLQGEAVDAARMFDYFSRLELRARDVERCKELRESRVPAASALILKAGEFLSELPSIHNDLFRCSTENVGRAFAEAYDTAASIVEGFEQVSYDILSRSDFGVLSEEASAIRRRTHFQKNSGPASARRSMVAKAAWKRNRAKNVHAIRAFHKSTAGKAFHRNLGRFNARRMENHDFTRDDILMTCKGISSLCTHALIEIEAIATQAAGRMTEAAAADSRALKDVFHVFQELLGSMVDAYFEEDKETIADVVDVVSDYYDITGGAGDRQVPDTAGVAGEVMP